MGGSRPDKSIRNEFRVFILTKYKKCILLWGTGLEFIVSKAFILLNGGLWPIKVLNLFCKKSFFRCWPPKLEIYFQRNENRANFACVPSVLSIAFSTKIISSHPETPESRMSRTLWVLKNLDSVALFFLFQDGGYEEKK